MSVEHTAVVGWLDRCDKKKEFGDHYVNTRRDPGSAGRDANIKKEGSHQLPSFVYTIKSPGWQSHSSQIIPIVSVDTD